MAGPGTPSSDRTDELAEPGGELRVLVVDGHVDDRGTGMREGLSEDRPQRARRVDPVALRAERRGQGHEVRVAELDAGFPPEMCLLLPLDEVVAAIAEDDVDNPEAEPACSLELLAVHEKAAVAADRHHPALGMDELGRDRGRQRET